MHQPNLYAKPEPAADGKAAPDGTPKPSKLVAQYWREIERYKRATSTWHEEGEQIERLYLDEDRTQNSARRFALLWANVETLKPAVYAKPPVVMCSRRYKDRDPVARIAAELMERATNTTFDLYNVDETFQMVRDDRLLPGRGQAWVRYEADIEQYEDDDEGDDEATLAEDGERPLREKVTGERVCTDYVHWTDFGHNVAGAWNDVWLCWRATYKTEEEVAGRFGAKMAAKLKYDAKAPASTSDKASSAGENAEDFCKIMEVWDKRRKLTSWISEGLKGEFIESGKPPVDLSNFFPCPKPCYATKTSKSLIPRPDYIYYRDQAKEINDLTAKIANMTDWLVVKGFVPGAPSRVSDAIEETIRDKGNREMFTQVESWTEWTEKGGIAKLIDWMPVDMIIKTLQAAIQARTQLIQDVFQITGLSDILRGATDPNETLGAQELKAQTGSRRLRNTKDEVARFCKDVARINAEIIAEKFDPETIAAITGYRYQPPAPEPLALPGMEQPLASNILPMLPAGGPMPSPAGGMPPVAPGMPTPPPAGPMMPQPGMAGGANQVSPDALMAGPAAAPPAPPSVPTITAAPPAMPQMPTTPMGMDAGQQQSHDMVFDDRVMKLLRDDRLRSFRIDIETDSTAQADEQAEKQSRTEFLNATGAYMEKAVTAMQGVPEVGGLAGEMLMFAVRGFRAGRALEEEIERTFGQLQEKAKAAAQQGPQPDPEVIKAQKAAEAMQQKMAADAQAGQQNAQFAQQKHEQDIQALMAKQQATIAAVQQQAQDAAQAHQQAMQAAAMKQQADQALANEKMRLLQAEAERSLLEHQMRMAEMERQAELKVQDTDLKREEFALRSTESEHKRVDMDERRQADIQDKTERREMEASFTADKVGKSTSQLNEKVIGAEAERQGKERDGLRGEVHAVAERITEQQAMIAEALKGLFTKQDETQNALLSAIKSLSAPRTIKRDPETGRALGVEMAAA